MAAVSIRKVDVSDTKFYKVVRDHKLRKTKENFGPDFNEVVYCDRKGRRAAWIDGDKYEVRSDLL